MDYELSKEQEMMRRAARDFLAKECPKTLVRQLEEEQAYSPDLWAKMADMGWLGLAFAEEYGGAGGSFLDLTVILEEVGRACVPSPFFSTVILGGLTVADAGTEEQKNAILPGLTEGKVKVTMALSEARGGYMPDAIDATARAVGDGFEISGTKHFVPDALVSDFLVAAAKTDGDYVGLFLVPGNAAGLTSVLMNAIGGDAQCETTFDRVKVPATAVLGGHGAGWPIVERALQRAAIGKCAEMLGQMEAALELATAYAKERVQFDRPIGSFQAIQHYCADMVLDVAGARMITYQAAWLMSNDTSCSKEVSMAKAWVGQAGRHLSMFAHRICGGIGLTTEHDMPIYSTRLRAGEVQYGGYSHHFERVAQELGL